MGVTKLNTLIVRNSVEDNKEYQTVIIDGSNLLFQTLTSQLSQWKKRNLVIKRLDAYDINIIKQTCEIIYGSVDSIVSFLNRCIDDVDHIYIALDPSKPLYKISDQMYFDKRFKECILGDLSESVFEIKSEEQEMRKVRGDKTESTEKTCKDLSMFLKDKYNASDEVIQMYLELFDQLFYYNITSHLLSLKNIIVHLVGAELQQTNKVLITQCKDEADLVIKNIAALHPDDNILVKSMDTDYYVLFADMPNVDVTDIRGGAIHNPNKCWKKLIPRNIYMTYEPYVCPYDFIVDEDRRLYNIVVRLAPLLGNDYTVHQPIISAEKFEDYISLLSGDYNSLRQNNRKTIGKVLNCRSNHNYHRETDVLSLEDLDDLIYHYDLKPDYFIKYYLSVIVYLNWHEHGHYSINTIYTEEDEDILINKCIANIFEDITSKAESEFATIYIDWNTNLMFSDPNAFIKTIQKKDCSTFDILCLYVDYMPILDDVEDLFAN